VHVREQANGGWRLISGARRLLAHQVLGLETIEACIHPKSSAEMTSLEDELIEISENLQRQKLTPLEEATHIRRYDELLDTLGLRARRGQPGTATRRTTAQLADELGMSERTYRNRLSVGRLPKAVQEAAKDSPIASKRTELTRLARLGDEQLQVSVLETIASGGAAGVDDAVATLANPTNPSPSSPSPRTHVEELLPASSEVIIWETMSESRWLKAFAHTIGLLHDGVLVTPAPTGRQLLDIRRYLSGTPVQHQAWIIVGNTVWAAWSRRSDITWPAAVDDITALRHTLEGIV
jgi:ParB-like chromosome segregation protein Spo0J